MKIAICEDELIDAESLCKILEASAKVIGIMVSIYIFSSVADLMKSIKRNEEYDFVIFDILMDVTNGVEGARELKNMLPEVEIAFVSHSSEYAVEAFALGSVHYLLKPVTQESVVVMMERVMKKMGINAKVLEIRVSKETFKFPMNRIIRIESENKGVAIYLRNQEEAYRVPKAFKEVEALIEPQQFIRVSRGLLVNMEYIRNIEGNTFIFKDDTSCLISRKDRNEIKEKYKNYLFERMAAVMDERHRGK